MPAPLLTPAERSRILAAAEAAAQLFGEAAARREWLQRHGHELKRAWIEGDGREANYREALNRHRTLDARGQAQIAVIEDVLRQAGRRAGEAGKAA